MSDADSEGEAIRVVLADANVLYSRVLRDYLLYAADREIFAITWSSRILAEVTQHLMANVDAFDQFAARRLVDAMNRPFPFAEVEPDGVHWRELEGMSLPDEGDRHVLVAALAAEATVLYVEHQRLPRRHCWGSWHRGAHAGPVAQLARA